MYGRTYLCCVQIYFLGYAAFLQADLDPDPTPQIEACTVVYCAVVWCARHCTTLFRGRSIGERQALNGVDVGRGEGGGGGGEKWMT